MNTNTMMLSVVLFALIAVPALAARDDDAQRAQAQEMGLVEIDSRFFDEVYGRDLDRISTVRSVYIADLDMSNVHFIEPRNQSLPRRSRWGLTEADREWLNSRYRESLTEAIEAAGYQLIDYPARSALVISAQLIELAPNAPRDDARNRRPSVDYYSEGTGELTISIQIRHDDRVLLSVLDERSAGYRWERNDSFHSQRNVARVFDRWAQNLVAQLSS